MNVEISRQELLTLTKKELYLALGFGGTGRKDQDHEDTSETLDRAVQSPYAGEQLEAA